MKKVLKKFANQKLIGKSEMNLYKYHTSPKELPGYKDRRNLVPDLAYKYCRSKHERGTTRLESCIAKDPWLAAMYAINFIKGRWVEAEQIIASNADASYEYASTIMKGRFELGEDAIFEDYETSQAYIHVVTVCFDQTLPEKWAKYYPNYQELQTMAERLGLTDYEKLTSEDLSALIYDHYQEVGFPTSILHDAPKWVFDGTHPVFV